MGGSPVPVVPAALAAMTLAALLDLNQRCGCAYGAFRRCANVGGGPAPPERSRGQDAAFALRARDARR